MHVGVDFERCVNHTAEPPDGTQHLARTFVISPCISRPFRRVAIPMLSSDALHYYEHALSLPPFASMEDEVMDFVVDVLKEVFA